MCWNIKVVKMLFVQIVLYIRFNGVAGEQINVALNKTANQSSVYADTQASGYAYKAVDGNANQDFYQGSCIHTWVSSYEWWEVDLGAVYHVTEVVIYNRVDYGVSRELVNYNISGGVDCNHGDDNNTTRCYSLCHHQEDDVSVNRIPLNCTAQYIRISKSGVLHFCEILIYGELVNDQSETTPTPITESSAVTSASGTTEVTTELYSSNSPTEVNTNGLPSDQTTSITTDGVQSSPVNTDHTTSTTRENNNSFITSIPAINLSTFEPFTTNFNSSLCNCLCEMRHVDQSEVAQFVTEIKVNLTVPRNTLSSTRRKKISAEDHRPSATYSGYAAMVVIVSFAAVIVIPDIMSILFRIRQICRCQVSPNL